MWLYEKRYWLHAKKEEKKWKYITGYKYCSGDRNMIQNKLKHKFLPVSDHLFAFVFRSDHSGGGFTLFCDGKASENLFMWIWFIACAL